MLIRTIEPSSAPKNSGRRPPQDLSSVEEKKRVPTRKSSIDLSHFFIQDYFENTKGTKDSNNHNEDDDSGEGIIFTVSPRTKKPPETIIDTLLKGLSEDKLLGTEISSEPPILSRLTLDASILNPFKALQIPSFQTLIAEKNIKLDHFPFLQEMGDQKLQDEQFSPVYTLEELVCQFEELEKLEEIFENQENQKNANDKKLFDALRVAIQRYQLAIMEAVTESVPHYYSPSKVHLPNSLWTYIVRAVLYVGGTWIAALEAYDAVDGTLTLAGLAAFPVWVRLIFTAPIFLVTFGVFFSFEANELDEHLGFHSANKSFNASSFIEVNQRKLEITNEFCKRLVHQSDKIDSKSYAIYEKLANKCIKSVEKVRDKVKTFKVSRTLRIVQVALVCFGMGYASSEAIFLAAACLSTGFLLSGPLGWIILGASALMGSALFFYGFNTMIRNKIAPELKAIKDLHETEEKFKNEHWFECIKKQRRMKTEIQVLQDEVNITKAQMENLKQSRSTQRAMLNGQLDKLQQKLREKSSQFQEFKEENIKLKKQVEALTEHKENLVKERKCDKEENETLKKELAKCQNGGSAARNNQKLHKLRIVSNRETFFYNSDVTPSPTSKSPASPASPASPVSVVSEPRAISSPIGIVKSRSGIFEDNKSKLRPQLPTQEILSSSLIR